MFKFHFKIYFLIIFLIFICSCSNTDTTEPVRPAETLVPPLNTPTLPAQAVLPTPSLPPPLPTELPTPQAVLASSTWLKTYGGRQDDTVEALLLAEDGDFYLAGSTNSQVDSGGLGETYLLRTSMQTGTSSGRRPWVARITP